MAFPIRALSGGAVPAQKGREGERAGGGDVAKGAFQVSELTCAILPLSTTKKMSVGEG